MFEPRIATTVICFWDVGGILQNNLPMLSVTSCTSTWARRKKKGDHWCICAHHYGHGASTRRCGGQWLIVGSATTISHMHQLFIFQFSAQAPILGQLSKHTVIHTIYPPHCLAFDVVANKYGCSPTQRARTLFRQQMTCTAPAPQLRPGNWTLSIPSDCGES